MILLSRGFTFWEDGNFGRGWSIGFKITLDMKVSPGHRGKAMIGRTGSMGAFLWTSFVRGTKSRHLAMVRVWKRAMNGAIVGVSKNPFNHLILSTILGKRIQKKGKV